MTNVAKIGNTPHNPVRYADTIGIVVERVRLSHHRGKSHDNLNGRLHLLLTSCVCVLDALRWYCSNPDCKRIVYEEWFHCTDLGTQLKPIIERFEASKDLRTCDHCGTLNHTK